MKGKTSVALYYNLVFFLLMGCNSVEIVPINPIQKVKVSNWLNGANSALTFTWDDTNPNHKIIADLLDEYGYKSTFFIYPGRYNWTLDCIKDVYVPISQKGHEIANHSMNHKDLTSLDDDELYYEINEPISIISDLMGVWPVSFAHPYSLLNPSVDSVIFENHLFSRRSSLYSMSNRILKGLNSNTTLTQTTNWIQTSVDQGKWLVITGHGIDNVGWEPINSAFLHQVCQIIKSSEKYIWVATLGEVAAYEYLKQELIVENSYTESTEELKISVLGFDNDKYEKVKELPISIDILLDPYFDLETNEKGMYTIVKQKETKGTFIITIDLKKTQEVTVHIIKP